MPATRASKDGGSGQPPHAFRDQPVAVADRNRRVVVAIKFAHVVLACFDTLYPVGAAAPTPKFTGTLFAPRPWGRPEDSKTSRDYNRQLACGNRGKPG